MIYKNFENLKKKNYVYLKSIYINIDYLLKEIIEFMENVFEIFILNIEE